jgi:dephospho-CoA kinase
MKVIGLTGGIGSGKSTVARFLAKLGAVVLDLDKLGHEALAPGSEAWKRVVDDFGKGILTANGDIDRAKLGSLVFNDREALERLNRIVHPVIDSIVNAKIDEHRRQGVRVVVLEAAAMLEAGRASQADEIWVTVAPGPVVISRISRRSGYSEEESKTRIQAQLSSEERIKQADVVIDTNCSLDELRARVVVQWHKLLARSEKGERL